MRGMTEQPSRRLSFLPWALCLVTLGIAATTLVRVLPNLPTIRGPEDANLIEIVLSMSLGLLGALIASRQPDNALGWVFLSIGLVVSVTGIGGQYTRYALLAQPGAPFTAWIPWVGDLSGTLV